MHVTVLAVPDCPHLPVLDERLAEALDGLPAVTVGSQLIATEDEAARSGMHGSPTILIDGLDPFAEPGQPTSVSCRLYRDSDGRTGGAPSVSQLRRALSNAANSDRTAAPSWLDALGRADRGRIAPAERGLRGSSPGDPALVRSDRARTGARNAGRSGRALQRRGRAGRAGRR